MEGTRMAINYPGLTKEMQAELEIRLQEFEKDHLDDVIHGGPGYVPKIRKVDFAIAWSINIAIGIWYIAAVLLYWSK